MSKYGPSPLDDFDPQISIDFWLLLRRPWSLAFFDEMKIGTIGNRVVDVISNYDAEIAYAESKYPEGVEALVDNLVEVAGAESVRRTFQVANLPPDGGARATIWWALANNLRRLEEKSAKSVSSVLEIPEQSALALVSGLQAFLDNTNASIASLETFSKKSTTLSSKTDKKEDEIAFDLAIQLLRWTNFKEFVRSIDKALQPPEVESLLSWARNEASLLSVPEELVRLSD